MVRMTTAAIQYKKSTSHRGVAMTVTQSKGAAPLTALPSSNSGEGGIRSSRFPHALTLVAVAIQVQVFQGLTVLGLVAVLSGCLGLFGIGFSTLSAQPDNLPSDHLPLFAANQSMGLLRRGRRSAGSSQGSVSPSDELCASYARFSSDAQREESIADQQRKCCQGAIPNGHSI